MNNVSRSKKYDMCNTHFFFLLFCHKHLNIKLVIYALFLGSINNIDDIQYVHCNKSQVRKVISGVVGASSSVTSIQVANLLRLFKIPQVHKLIALFSFFL